MRNCGHCHACGRILKLCLDGEEWCVQCQAYRRYRSHGWSKANADTRAANCPRYPERLSPSDQQAVKDGFLSFDKHEE